MSQTPESKVKLRVDAIIASLSPVIVNPITRGLGTSGVSDKLTCIQGRFVAIEVKSVQAKGAARYPTKLQYKFLHAVLIAGGGVAVVNETNLEQLKEWLCSGSKVPLLFDGCPSVEQGSVVRKISTE